MSEHDLPELLEVLGHEGLILLQRVLEGRGSPEEEEQVRQWLREDARLAELVGRIRHARLVAALAPELWDVDDAIRRFLAHVDQGSAARAGVASVETEDEVRPEAPSETVVLPFPGRRDPRRVAPARTRRGWGSRLGVAVRIAATIALLVSGTLLWQNRDTLFGPTEGPLQELATGVRERIRLTLADGTHVILGPNSRLHYPERFGRTRDLRLEGEAVFEVATDSARPFRVRAGNATTRVLGTRFGVRAFPEDEFVEVMVVEGRVEVTAETTSSTEAMTGTATRPVHAVQLTTDQAVRVSADGVLGSRRVVDAARHLSWTEGNLYFDGITLADVSALLERRYGTRIEFADQKIAGLYLTAEFLEPASFAEVVHAIAVSLGLEHRRTATGYLLSHPAHQADTPR